MNVLTGLEVEVVDPKTLTDIQVAKVYELIQEIWAEGTWEFVRCGHCNKVFSKHDIFWDLPADLYHRPVSQIMELIHKNEISCPQCESETTQIYGKEGIGVLQKKYRDSSMAFLALMKNERGEFVGFSESYVDSFKHIYERDLAIHYEKIGSGAIRTRIEKVLENVPDKMVIFSGIWTRQHYRNMDNLFKLMNSLNQKMNEAKLQYPGIMELDKWHLMHKIFSACQWISLEVDVHHDVSWQIMNLPSTYQSDLVVFRDPIPVFKEEFSMGPHKFFRKHRAQRVSHVKARSPELVA